MWPLCDQMWLPFSFHQSKTEQEQNSTSQNAVEEVGWWIWCDEDSDQLLSVHWFGRWRRCWVPTSYYGSERAGFLSCWVRGSEVFVRSRAKVTSTSEPRVFVLKIWALAAQISLALIQGIFGASATKYNAWNSEWSSNTEGLSEWQREQRRNT